MRVSNEDCPPFTIHGCDTDPRPACFAEIVSYDFHAPLHAAPILFFCLPRRDDKWDAISRRTLVPPFLSRLPLATWRDVTSALLGWLLGLPLPNDSTAFLRSPTGMIFTMIVAGFAEETLFRGYLFERLGKLFGTGSGKSIHRPAHLGVVCLGPLLQSRASWCRTGDDHGPRLWDDLLNHGSDLDGDVCACCVRSCGGRDNLLEPRSHCRSPRALNKWPRSG